MQTADFYSSATGTLRVNGGRDENAPQGVSLSIDDLSYIKQGSRANDAEPVTDYDLLDNKPQINNITLTGNKSLNDLGIQPKIDSSHKVSADNIDDTDTTNKFATAAQLEQITINQNNILTVADQSTQYNLAIDNSFTTTAYKIVTIDTLKANTTYVICFGTLSSTDTDDTKSTVLLTYNGGTAIVQAVAERGNNIVLTITPTSDCNQMNVYAALTYANSVGDTLTVSNLQIVEKTIWDKGFTAYQPYARSNAELTTNKQDKLLTGYSATVTPTSQQTIVATDSVIEGFEKLDNNVRLNEYNISSLLLSDTGKTGDLNDVTVTEFAIYTDQSTHLPTQSFYYVRTTTNSSAGSRLQEAFEMVTAEAYVRTYAGDMWSAWLKITNLTT